MELQCNILDNDFTLKKNDTIELLLNNWFVENVDGMHIFYKHIKSPDDNDKLYQIVLANSDMDGIYQLETIDSKMLNSKISGNTLKLELQDNLDVYAFHKHFNGFQKENSYTIQRKNLECILRCQFVNDECFKTALFNTGLITAQEYNLYINPKQSLIRNTKNLSLVLS